MCLCVCVSQGSSAQDSIKSACVECFQGERDKMAQGPTVRAPLFHLPLISIGLAVADPVLEGWGACARAHMHSFMKRDVKGTLKGHILCVHPDTGVGEWGVGGDRGPVI